MTRAGDPVLTRASLIAAARAVIAECGVASASVKAISRRAGVTSGAFYYSFASKEALLAAVAEELRVDLIPPAVDLSTVSAHDVAEALHAAVLSSRDALMLQLELWLYAIRNAELKQLLGAATRANREGSVARLGFVDNPITGALTAQSMLIGMSMLMLIDDSLTTEDLTAALGSVLTALQGSGLHDSLTRG